jgi:hypothetical protein
MLIKSESLLPTHFFFFFFFSFSLLLLSVSSLDHSLQCLFLLNSRAQNELFSFLLIYSNPTACCLLFSVESPECTACCRRTPDIDLHIGQHRVCLIAER